MTSPHAEESQKSIAVLYRLAVSLAIFFSIVLVIGVWHLGSNSMIACGFLGALFIHFGSRPSLMHVSLSLAAGIIVAFLYALLGGPFGPNTFSYLMGAGAFLGVGSILVMSLHQVWTRSSPYALPLRDALILPVFSLIAGLCMHFANGGSHSSFDFLLYRFDSSLGLAPGPFVVSLFRELPWIRTGSSLFYGGLLCFPPLYHGWASYNGKVAKVHLMHAFVVAGVGGFVLYQICPAVGPLVTFGPQFPDRLPAMSAVPMNAFMSTSVHNAMPSMHMTWALLVWVAAWELGSFAVAMASVFVMFTGLAAVGFGEHYLIDLIVSVPLVMMVQGICTARHKLTAIGLGLVVAWTVYLRTGIQLPTALNWLSMIATVMTTVFMMRTFPATGNKPRNPSRACSPQSFTVRNSSSEVGSGVGSGSRISS
ncbi:MAG TPA: phosphatase PAP2 family protein [Bryobacteraceae bacterium]|nr:phosphatase PAP2 family protein [Bryobacteraceae bacterium]